VPLSIPPESQHGFDVPVSSAGQSLPGATLLNVDYIAQSPWKWLCWAACCEMVLRANNIPTTGMCQTAQLFAGASKNCCTDCSECDSAYTTPEAAYKRWHVPCDPPYGYAFSWEGLSNEIVHGGRPVEIYFLWNGGNAAHLALAIGLHPSDQTVFVNDPYFGRGWVAYDDVLVAYHNGGVWRQSWQGIGYSLGTLS
jgi:hypothetical protein